MKRNCKYEAEGKPITGAKTPAGSFSLVKGGWTSGIAVDSSESKIAGDVYVADIAHGVVDRFNEKGKYLGEITGVATPAGSIEPRGIAVNASGDLYVADVAHDVIDEFGPKGEYLKQLVDPKPEPGAIALASSGDVYVANGEASFPTGVVEFAPGGSVVPRPELEGTRALSVAVDPHSGDVLLGEPLFAISEFPAAAGGRVASFGTGGDALAFAKGREQLLANASTESTITVYRKLEIIPEIRTGVATGVAAESATLNGVLTPDPKEQGTTICRFEYGTTTGYGGTPGCEPRSGAGYAETTAVSATVVKLSPGTTYHFRLSAKDGGDPTPTYSADEEFTTPSRVPVAPVVSAEAANPSVTTATVRAQIAPGGSSASCEVQFVEEAQFKVSGYAGAASAPCLGPALGAGYSAQQALADLEGLRAGTVYHYRFVASNVGPPTGTSTGEEATFATFGIREFSAQVLDKEGHQYTQAGGHPYKLLTNVEFNVGTDLNGHRATDANPRDIVTALPPGYIGNPTATPRCTFAELVRALCNRAAQVGVIRLRLDSEEDVEPLYNLVPPAGYPAALGFRIATFTTVSIVFKLRTGSDYGIDAEALDSSTNAGLEGATVEVWGVPAAPSHDHERACLPPGVFGTKVAEEECSVTEPVVPFLTNPTSCAGPQTETVRADSWQDPEIL